MKLVTKDKYKTKREDKWDRLPSREEEKKIEDQEEVPIKEGHISQEKEQHAFQDSY